MDIRKIKKLIELLQETGIAEIEIKEGEELVRLSRYPKFSTEIPPIQYHTTAPSHTLPTGGTQVTQPATEPTSSVPKESFSTGHQICSPMVGTFYASPSPDAPSFVKLGQTVKAGDTLCIIEAMKMFNEIEADRTGVIASMPVKNGEPVEYGQVLFVIEE